jgi:P27 family predicted phage terminase small subunit
MRGRKIKPTILKVIEGNPGHRPLPDNEPIPTGNLKAAPMWMSPAQKEGWNYVIKYAPRGLLKKIDNSVLAIWICAEDTHREAAMKVSQHGLVHANKETKRITINPFIKIMNQQALIMIKAASEMGFTPASRPRIKLESDGGTQEEESFFN